MMKLQSTMFELLSGRVLSFTLGRKPYRCVWLTGGGSNGCSTCVGIFKTLSRSRPVCLLVTIASPASAVERFEMQFGMWTRGAQETVFRCWCKLAPPSEYDCMIHAFRRCDLLSICLAWFDFLLHLFRFCARVSGWKYEKYWWLFVLRHACFIANVVHRMNVNSYLRAVYLADAHSLQPCSL